MSTQDQIKKAIGAHGLWKTRLAAAIDVGKSEFTVDTVRKDNACNCSGRIAFVFVRVGAGLTDLRG